MRGINVKIKQKLMIFGQLKIRNGKRTLHLHLLAINIFHRSCHKIKYCVFLQHIIFDEANFPALFNVLVRA